MDGTEEMLRAMYLAFNREDADEVLARMREDVDWPNTVSGGRVHGHAAVRAYWQGQWERVKVLVEPLWVREDESGRWVVQVHQVVRDLEGKVLLDRRVEHVYEAREGLIARMDVREAAEGE